MAKFFIGTTNLETDEITSAFAEAETAKEALRLASENKHCRHCRREIRPAGYGAWQDADNPGYEACDLANGPSHEP